MAEVEIDERNLGDQFDSDGEDTAMQTEVRFNKLTPHQMNVRHALYSMSTESSRARKSLRNLHPEKTRRAQFLFVPSRISLKILTNHSVFYDFVLRRLAALSQERCQCLRIDFPR